ncbi:hypothetical protein Tco_0932186, partial [Tanacetum coccineum]
MVRVAMNDEMRRWMAESLRRRWKTSPERLAGKDGGARNLIGGDLHTDIWIPGEAYSASGKKSSLFLCMIRRTFEFCNSTEADSNDEWG